MEKVQNPSNSAKEMVSNADSSVITTETHETACLLQNNYNLNNM
jgi:hypothetical protein